MRCDRVARSASPGARGTLRYPVPSAMQKSHTAILVLAAFAAACASPPRRLDDAEWAAIQRARLRALRQAELAVEMPETVSPSRPAAAVARRTAAPQGQEPAPRNIDQIEPRRRAIKNGAAGMSANAAVGVGNLDVRMGGTRLHGDDVVAAVRATVEAPEGTKLGPGVALEYMRTGDGLFAGELYNDGQQVRAADARADAIDCNPYLVWRPDVGAGWQLPVHFGAFVDTLRVQHGGSPVRREWFGYGLRVAAEPTWLLADDGDTRWDLVGRIGGDVGGARFRENFVGGRDEDQTLRLMGEAGLGIRMTSGAFTGELDYRLRAIDFGDTTTDLLGPDRHTTVRTDMVWLQAGVRF